MDKAKRIISSRKIGLLVGIAVSVAVAWLFFDSVWGLVLAPIIIPFCVVFFYQLNQEKSTEQNVLAIKELLLLLSSFLQAGIALENAFVESEKELKNLFPGKNQVITELHKMNQQVAVSVPVERAFAVLARNLDLEEVYEFADVLFYAKRLGGNYIQNVQRTALKLEEKLGVSQEIDTMIAEKRFEFYIMIGMPILILAYVKFTSMDFISILYHSLMGVMIMGGCLIFYVFMALLGRKIIQIKV